MKVFSALLAFTLALTPFAPAAAEPGGSVTATLAIKVDTVGACPRDATIMAWSHSQFKRPMVLHLESENGNAVLFDGHSSPRLASSGLWFDERKEVVKIHASTDTRYRLQVWSFGKIVAHSNWVPLVAAC
ncbi:MAG: hypothetical protein AAF748_06425 [Pseudomonadota bacterium]